MTQPIPTYNPPSDIIVPPPATQYKRPKAHTSYAKQLDEIIGDHYDKFISSSAKASELLERMYSIGDKSHSSSLGSISALEQVEPWWVMYDAFLSLYHLMCKSILGICEQGEKDNPTKAVSDAVVQHRNILILYIYNQFNLTMEGFNDETAESFILNLTNEFDFNQYIVSVTSLCLLGPFGEDPTPNIQECITFIQKGIYFLVQMYIQLVEISGQNALMLELLKKTIRYQYPFAYDTDPHTGKTTLVDDVMMIRYNFLATADSLIEKSKNKDALKRHAYAVNQYMNVFINCANNILFDRFANDYSNEPLGFKYPPMSYTYMFVATLYYNTLIPQMWTFGTETYSHKIICSHSGVSMPTMTAKYVLKVQPILDEIKMDDEIATNDDILYKVFMFRELFPAVYEQNDTTSIEFFQLSARILRFCIQTGFSTPTVRFGHLYSHIYAGIALCKAMCKTINVENERQAKYVKIKRQIDEAKLAKMKVAEAEKIRQELIEEEQKTAADTKAKLKAAKLAKLKAQEESKAAKSKKKVQGKEEIKTSPVQIGKTEKEIVFITPPQSPVGRQSSSPSHAISPASSPPLSQSYPSPLPFTTSSTEEEEKKETTNRLNLEHPRNWQNVRFSPGGIKITWDPTTYKCKRDQNASPRVIKECKTKYKTYKDETNPAKVRLMNRLSFAEECVSEPCYENGHCDAMNYELAVYRRESPGDPDENALVDRVNSYCKTANANKIQYGPYFQFNPKGYPPADDPVATQIIDNNLDRFGEWDTSSSHKSSQLRLYNQYLNSVRSPLDRRVAEIQGLQSKITRLSSGFPVFEEEEEEEEEEEQGVEVGGGKGGTKNGGSPQRRRRSPVV